MPKIFISYRREDAQHQADRIHAALKKAVRDPRRDIFIDIDNIPAGVDFVDHLDGKVAECDVLLALIGPDWLEARNTKTGQRRLDDPQDFVRIEIASALKRGKVVAPVLLDGTPMPGEGELPFDLRQLARRNGVEVRRATFDADAARMIQKLDLRGLEKTRAATAAAPRVESREPAPAVRAPSARAPVAHAPAKPGGGGRVWMVAVAFLVVLTGGVVAAWVINPGDWRGESNAPRPTPSDSAIVPSASPDAPASTSPSHVAGKLPATLERKIEAHWDFISGLTFNRDGTHLLSASADRTAKVWDAKTGELVLALPALPHQVTDASYSSDESKILTGCYDGSARIWDAHTGKKLFTLSGHRYSAEAAYSPRGGRVVISSDDGTASVWDAAAGTRLALLGGHKDSVDATFSPDESHIAVTTADGVIDVWDGTTWAKLRSLPLGLDRVEGNQAVFYPDGERLVAPYSDGLIRIWNVETGKKLATLQGHTKRVNRVEFSRDYSRFVSTSRDDTVRIWDANTWANIATLEGHTDSVVIAHFSADGSRVISAGQDGNVRIWDSRTGESLAVLHGDGSSIYQIALSPDGSRIVAGTHNGNIYIWKIGG